MGKIAARYQPDVFTSAAMPENNAAAFSDLGSLVKSGETIFSVGAVPGDVAGWEVIHTIRPRQMVCDKVKPASRIEAIVLTAEDVPEMLELVALAQPGPFLPRTIEMGQYLGLRQDGQLVAMAGERMHLTGFCEVSAVCTHPDYRGRGYGGALTSLVAERILERGEMPFLHVVHGNDIAFDLYKKLGFRLRKEIVLSVLKRLASPRSPKPAFTQDRLAGQSETLPAAGDAEQRQQ